MNKDFLQIDAYKILQISLDATEEEIRLAYHQKIQEGADLTLIGQAYSLIKDASARRKYLLFSMYSYFIIPPVVSFEKGEVEAVIKEIAFLSDWELGESI